MTRRPNLTVIQGRQQAQASPYADRSPAVVNDVSRLASASSGLSRAFSGSFVTEAARKQAYALAVEAAATARRIVEALS